MCSPVDETRMKREREKIIKVTQVDWHRVHDDEYTGGDHFVSINASNDSRCLYRSSV